MNGMQMIDIADIHPAPYNPRKITDEAYHELQGSLRTLGFILPIIVNADNMRIVADYLCGVASDRKWAHNLHIAFTPAAGQVIDIDDGFCKIRIENARRLDISPEYIDKGLPQHRNREFCTCRNWQFANMIAKGLYPSYVKRARLGDEELEIFE